MKISEKLKENSPHICCEIFPPKQWAKIDDAKRVAARIAKLRPDYMSVTYGATGGTSEYTVDIANELQNNLGVPTLAHLTCLSSDKQTVGQMVSRLKECKIENILALRGDRPQNPDVVLPDDYHYASELIEDIKSMGDFCIAGACYPEGHPESPSVDSDIRCLKRKVDTGCDFLISQMFFDNNIFYNFLYKALKAGIDVPVVAGIMPVTNKTQIGRIIELSGNIIPPRFKMIIDRFGDDPDAMMQAGIAYATDQIIDLFANGVNNVNIYTMNKPEVAEAIFKNLSCIARR